jgi:hypothetical protein
MKWLLCLCFLLAAAPCSYAQDRSQTKEDFARKPLWIDMLEDTSANYFTVEQAFNTYFAHHELPEGEHDVIGEHHESEKIPSRRKQRRIWADNKLRMDVKHYYLWREQMLPYVQADGRILTPTERLAIWKAQGKG